MNIEHFTQATVAVQIHILVAVSALFLGAFVLLNRKGTNAHKLAGRVFGLLTRGFRLYARTDYVDAVFCLNQSAG